MSATTSTYQTKRDQLFKDLEGEPSQHDIESISNENSRDGEDFKAQIPVPAPVVLPPVVVEETNEEDEQACECGNTTFAEDHRSGDWVCDRCGLVKTERLIATDAEYRVFSDDSESKSKIRVGAAYNPLMEYSLTEKNRMERDEKEFLWDGLRNVDDIFSKLYHGDCNNTASQHRARELFQKAFRKQVNQKQGIGAPMKRTGEITNKRQKFSRRKQFVVACIWAALRENGIKEWGIPELSEQLEGISVSTYSVKSCLKDLEDTCIALRNSDGLFLTAEGDGIACRAVPNADANNPDSIPSKFWFYAEQPDPNVPGNTYKLRSQFNRWLTIDEDNRVFTSNKEDHEFQIERKPMGGNLHRTTIRAGNLYLGVRKGKGVKMYPECTSTEQFVEFHKTITPGIPH